MMHTVRYAKKNTVQHVVLRVMYATTLYAINVVDDVKHAEKHTATMHAVLIVQSVLCHTVTTV